MEPRIAVRLIAKRHWKVNLGQYSIELSGLCINTLVTVGCQGVVLCSASKVRC
jgi:hypothetical protein